MRLNLTRMLRRHAPKVVLLGLSAPPQTARTLTGRPKQAERGRSKILSGHPCRTRGSPGCWKAVGTCRPLSVRHRYHRSRRGIKNRPGAKAEAVHCSAMAEKRTQGPKPSTMNWHCTVSAGLGARCKGVQLWTVNYGNVARKIDRDLGAARARREQQDTSSFPEVPACGSTYFNAPHKGNRWCCHWVRDGDSGGGAVHRARMCRPGETFVREREPLCIRTVEGGGKQAKGSVHFLLRSWWARTGSIMAITNTSIVLTSQTG